MDRAAPGDPLVAIWERHRPELLERVGLIERAVGALLAGDLREPLRVEAQAAAHMLVGSAGTFGFARASQSARKLELGLDAPCPAQAARLSELVHTLRRQLTEDSASSSGEPPLHGENALQSENGVPRHAIGVPESIAQRRAAEQVKDEFISIVGHELRTPLTSIRGSLGLLEGGVLGELSEDALSMLSLAIVNTDRLVRLINDILDIERMDAGRVEVQLAPVDASDVLRQAIQVVQMTAVQAKVTLRTDAAELTVCADLDRVVQALVNLLGNAIKFAPHGSTVTTTVVAEGEHARFSVSDAGRGIPADRLEAIFERFRQVDASDAREKGGSGLGLPIARGIVEHHGGKMWVESLEGAGSTFHFTLPLHGDREAQAAVAATGEAR